MKILAESIFINFFFRLVIRFTSLDFTAKKRLFHYKKSFQFTQ